MLARDNTGSKRFLALREERARCETGEGGTCRWRPGGCPKGIRLPCVSGLRQPWTLCLRQTSPRFVLISPDRGDTPSHNRGEVHRKTIGPRRANIRENRLFSIGAFAISPRSPAHGGVATGRKPVDARKTEKPRAPAGSATFNSGHVPHPAGAKLDIAFWFHGLTPEAIDFHPLRGLMERPLVAISRGMRANGSAFVVTLVSRRCSVRLLQEPRAGEGIFFEELQQHLRDFLTAALAGVGAIARQVLPLPDQVVALPRGGPIRPEIGPPQQERGLACAVRIVVP